MCQALIGIHAYTGCDTVSAFAGIGKALNNADSQQGLPKYSYGIGLKVGCVIKVNEQAHATSMLPRHLVLKSTSLSIICSVPRRVRLRVLCTVSTRLPKT